MPTYQAPLRDFRFVLHEVLDSAALSQLPGYADFAPEVLDSVLEEAAKMAEQVLFPLNQSGDAEGCHYENGVVRTPKGFKEAYQQFRDAGWCGLSADPKYGGQGAPQVLDFAIGEIISSANLSFGMYPGLSHGAVNALHMWGTDAQKDLYLPKIISGEWSGTMCLTEPHCGTDLGLIRTKAEPLADGAFAISGTKIFISAGEHDLTQNIVHLVLAKLPDAPAGTKGISLFVVPKFLPNEDGTVGPSNGVRCGSIEHKMGIKASSTCVMNFDNAKGWLVGAPHAGMKAMFTMMNAARLAVGLQGLALAEVSYQNARAYAKDRRQGRALSGAKEPAAPADMLIVHPDVRKNLLTMKAFCEGARALGLWVGYHLDLYEKHPDPAMRAEADDLVALMTPIIKSVFTDRGFDATNIGVQIFGGHGYVRDYGMEQYVRDARITQIYEGANGIQALDLIGRKLPTSMGRLLRQFFHPAAALAQANLAHPLLAQEAGLFGKGLQKLQQATMYIAEKGLSKPEEAAAGAMDYLNMFGLVALGYMWLRMGLVASEKLAQATDEKAFYEAKLHTMRFFFGKIYPQVNAYLLSIQSGGKVIMALPAEDF